MRSYSKKINDNKNKVHIYVFTYFDLPNEEDIEFENNFLVDGRICKLDDLRMLNDGKCNIHFILANNIIQNGHKLNSYLPCIAWGNCAKEISKLQKNDNVVITGELKSREYKKFLSDEQFEIKIAHELVVTDFKKLKND